VLALLAPKAGERILDVGCGTGHLTKQIADAGATVIGIDNSPDMIAAAQRAYPTIAFIQADATDFHFEEKFDAVFSNATLHWVRPPEDAARCMANALRDGGRFVAEFGGQGNIDYIRKAVHAARHEIAGEDAADTYYFPSIGEYAPLLEQQGLEVQAAWLFDRPTLLEGEDGMANWLLMFGAGMLRGLTTDMSTRVTAQAERTLRATNYQDGKWFADYRRIRIVAIKR
jgi:trans-aconitate 2-methyltransferase